MIWYYCWVSCVKEIPHTKFAQSLSIWTDFSAFYPNLGKCRSFFASITSQKGTKFKYQFNSERHQVQNIATVPGKNTKNCFLVICTSSNCFCYFKSLSIGLKYMTPSRIKKNVFSPKRKVANFFGCSGHLVVWFYPRIQLLFCFSRYVAVFTELFTVFESKKNSLYNFQ